MTAGTAALERPQVLSFRDPAGALFKVDGHLFRRVSAAHTPVLEHFLNSRMARSMVESERLIESRFVSDTALLRTSSEGLINTNDSVVEHDRVWFPSYPYEWCTEMLLEAGRLTVELSLAGLDEGFGLKDATPYNVLFRGPKPVFVDLLSFEKRTFGDPTWLPYAQFQRMFLLPLLMNQEFGTRMGEIFLEHRDGLEPEAVYRYANWTRRLRPFFLSNVSIPTWLSKRADKSGSSLYQPTQTDPEKAGFILRTQLKSLAKRLKKLTPSSQKNSGWSSYMQTLSYSDQEFAQKTETVNRWMSELRPQTVLDIGCNTGHFSAIAARLGARVVAIDADPAVVGSTWQRASAEKLDILPLTVNIARPTPAVGWRNAEYPSFLERATGSFEMVTMLAVVHHLIVTERIPLQEVFSLTSQLTTRYAIVEYVSKDDAMFQRLTRGREALHAHFTQEVFETVCSQSFKIVKKQSLKEDLRCLYLLQKREP